MNLSVDELSAASTPFTSRVTEAALRRRAEALLGFGSTSPARGFSPSSRS
jgi:hypothetical protein